MNHDLLTILLAVLAAFFAGFKWRKSRQLDKADKASTEAAKLNVQTQVRSKQIQELRGEYEKHLKAYKEINAFSKPDKSSDPSAD